MLFKKEGENGFIFYAQYLGNLFLAFKEQSFILLDDSTVFSRKFRVKEYQLC